MESPARPEEYQFKLFIAGMSGKSVIAVDNLRRICEEYLENKYTIEIIDLSRDPHLAARHEIIAIPTLIKTAPYGIRTILGDLSDTAKVLKILEID